MAWVKDLWAPFKSLLSGRHLLARLILRRDYKYQTEIHVDLQGASGFSHARTRRRCGLQNGDACTRSIQSPRVKAEAKEVFENVRSKIRLQLHIRLTGRQTPGGLSAGRCCPDVRVRTRISFLLTFTEMFRNARRENLSRVLTYTRGYKNNKYTHARSLAYTPNETKS